MNTKRQLGYRDKLCLGIDQVIRALTDNPQTTAKPYPARALDEALLTDAERKSAAALMRINHAGEICAQALYHGQAMVTRCAAIEQKMQTAALEEGDHLAWCKKRLDELGSHTSYLNPLWYAGSFCIGMIAGKVGDQWSLGFVAETERQVIQHLQEHLQHLPEKDVRSQRILQQMEQDEAGHRDAAIAAGAHPLPKIVQQVMAFTSKIMVKTAYFI